VTYLAEKRIYTQNTADKPQNPVDNLNHSEDTFYPQDL
jgi:hypothetical protein